MAGRVWIVCFGWLVLMGMVQGCEGTTADDAPETCIDSGQVYEVGESWECSDGCNSCGCLDGGVIAQTDMYCGPEECTPEDCGPELGLPNYLCEDGETTAGPGDCELQNDGTCGWTIVECPEPVDACDDLDCEPCIDGQCVGEDELCEPGESFDAADGCNSCECPESGLIAEAACTEMACEQACGSQAECAADQFCDFTYDDCGLGVNTTMGGTCQARPEECLGGGADPGVCGCDGSWRNNTCELQSGGSDYQKYGGCLILPGEDTFVCGSTTCQVANEICIISMNDIFGGDEPEFYSNCAPLPEGCSQGDCSCMSHDEWTECFEVSGHTTLIYPGG